MMLSTVFATAVGVPAAGAEHGGEHGSSVVARQLALSAHRNLGCASCHGHGPIGHAPFSVLELLPFGRAEGRCQVCHRRAAREHFRGPHGKAELRGDARAPTCVSCHGSHGVKRVQNPTAPVSPVRAPLSCGRCHRRPAEEFVASVHGEALRAQRRNENPPTCATCHGAHAAASPRGRTSPVARTRVAGTCSECHVEANLMFGRSVHAAALAANLRHAPTCTDCHGAHTVTAMSDAGLPAARFRAAQDLCGRCHGSAEIVAQHGLLPGVVEDFRRSFHGLAGAAGDRRVATCSSCHGYHEIRASVDRLSSTHPANLGRTCGECHPGAGDRFAQGGIHRSAAIVGFRVVKAVGLMYPTMIVVVIGLMAVHNVIDCQRRLRDRCRRNAVADPVTEEQYLRFTVNERLQHWLLAGSFVLLAVSGFALRFGWRVPGVDGTLQEMVRAGVHRGAATLLGGLSLYHLGYIALTRRGRETARAILPRIRRIADLVPACTGCLRLGPPTREDWRALFATVRYNLGLADKRPAYGRFTYWEKMEYWALFWGTLVMAATGLVLWFEVPFLNWFPYWAWELFRTVHFYEAVLAVLAILVWHMYYTVLNPDAFPLNRAMTRGTLTYEEMEREHSLDLFERREGDVPADLDRTRAHGGHAHHGGARAGAGLEPGRRAAPESGEAPDRETSSGREAPEADGGHQRS
jgi:cytochrome b subunit of formate dehydrogenase